MRVKGASRGGLKMAVECDSTGKRRRVYINGQRVYVIVTRGADGRYSASWTMPHENRKTLPGKRRISPYEAGVIKATIQKLMKEI